MTTSKSACETAAANYESIRVEVDRGVATLILHRPERLNAYTAAMGAELFGALAALDADEAVRAIVVTGAGRAFCAGADLAGGSQTFAGDGTWDPARENEDKVKPWKMNTPVIAALNGPAVGIGATLPLQWDIRLASDRARIGFVFARRGIIAEAGSTYYLPRLIGLSRAMELLLTARILSAEEALSFGLVSRVLPHDELMPFALAMAHDIAAHCAPVSVAVTRRLLWRQLVGDDPIAGKDLEDRLFHWIGKQPDAAEGVTAFLEKREPRWTMGKNRDFPRGMGLDDVDDSD